MNQSSTNGTTTAFQKMLSICFVNYEQKLRLAQDAKRHIVIYLHTHHLLLTRPQFLSFTLNWAWITRAICIREGN